MDSLAITNKKVSNSKNLLIVKMDAIGDYILFRNFLKAIKEDKKYSKYKITLCGNSVWKDISEKFDSKETVFDDRSCVWFCWSGGIFCFSYLH